MARIPFLPILLVAILLATAPGPAYLVHHTPKGEEIGWDLDGDAPNANDGRVTFFVDPDGVPDIVPEDFLDAVRAGVGAWSGVAGSRFLAEEDPSRPADRKNASDRVNRLGFQQGVVGPFTYAVAYRRAKGPRLLDVDVVFNPSVRLGSGGTAPWSIATPGVLDTADVRAVTTHEWGHAIGLDHVPLGASTMFFSLPAGAILFRSLAPDDAAAVGHLYSSASLGTDFATLRGTVDVAGTTGDRGVQVTAVDVVTGRPAVSDVSEPDGSFRIEGLPPGVSRLVASPLGRAAVERGVYGSFWDGAVAGFLPEVFADPDGATALLVLAAGEVRSGIALRVATASLPGEPDDQAGEARLLAVGASATGRIEHAGDVDRHAFPGTAGQRVSAWVHARQLGSSLDPRLDLVHSTGFTLASSRDIRAGSGSFDEEGFDLDARLLDVTLPLGGTWHLLVRNDGTLPEDTPVEDLFYVLTLLPASGDPHPATSGLTLSPAVLDGDGVSAATAVFRPRTLAGADAGPVPNVTMGLAADGDGADGTSGAVVDGGDGTWEMTITAPAAGGRDTVEARIDGTPFRTTSLLYRGPPDAAASTLELRPRRIRSDGIATAAVEFLPRDAAGLAHGPGRSVVFSFTAGTPGASLGPGTDRGDGSYGGTLTAGTVAESTAVTVSVGGVPVGASVNAAVGFPLEEVLAAGVAEATGWLSLVPESDRGSTRRALRARSALAEALLSAAGEDLGAALRSTARAASRVRTAIRRGAPLTDLLGDLAEAAREAAEGVLEEAGGKDPLSPADLRRLDRAAARFGKGDTLLGSGLPHRAASLFATAARRALPVLGE